MSLDPSTLVWMIINFLVLMLLLNRFLFKPLLTFMQQRQDKIDEGLQAGERAKALLEEKEQELARNLAGARAAANQAISDANRQMDARLAANSKENEAYESRRLTEIAGVLFAEEESLAASAETHISEYVSILQEKISKVSSPKAIAVADATARDAFARMLHGGDGE